ARFAACTGRDEPFGLHHVHETRGAAEPDPQLPLEIRDRRLAAADDDARGFVVEVVLLELRAFRSRLLVLCRDRVVEDRFALLAKEAREPRALLLRDIRPVKPDAAR